MQQVMFDVNAVIEKINQGKNLLLAADEKILSQLPQGNWIGGTIPYFMAEQGGLFTKDKIFVTELPEYIENISIKNYDEKNIENVYLEIPDNGFGCIIIPASCQTHLNFALNAPGYKGFATHPLVGWISGIDLNDLGKISPKVFNGQEQKGYENGAIVMQVLLPETKIADINIINIFEQGDGDAIEFPQDSFQASEAIVKGEKINFASYIKENNLDTKLPLVADYYGAMINISFQAVEDQNVSFYAPVFSGMTYKQAKPVQDYVTKFLSEMPKEGTDQIIFSCNCILNYLYSELEGKTTGGITGPITFGEIAYQLLNQTLVYLTITDIS